MEPKLHKGLLLVDIELAEDLGGVEQVLLFVDSVMSHLVSIIISPALT